MAQKLVFDGRLGWVFRPEDPSAWFVETTTGGKAAAAVVAELLPILRDDLKLAPIRVRYFAKENTERKAWREAKQTTPWEHFEGEPGMLGRCAGAEPGTVWLKADLGVADGVEVLAHELRHSQHFRDFVEGKAELPGDAQGEREATEYGKAIRKTFETTGVAA